MYEIFIYDHKSSHCFYDNEIGANKYPHIKLGSRVFIPDLEITYLVLGPGKWVPLGKENDPGESPDEPAAAGLTVGFNQGFQPYEVNQPQNF